MTTSSGYKFIDANGSHEFSDIFASRQIFEALNNTSNLWNISGVSPVQVFSGTTWNQVNGNNHSIAIKNDNTLWAWGPNDYGECGVGTSSIWGSVAYDDGYGNITYNWEVITSATVNSPTQIVNSSAWSQVVNNNNNAMLGIKGDGSLWACGYNAQYRLGDGTTVNKSLPVQVTSMIPWKQVIYGER